MTPREKADAIVAELRRQGSGWSGDLSSAIEHAIVAAIIGEREACRKAVRSVADELHPERDHVRWSQWTSAIEEAEKRIRARGENV